MKPDLAEKPAGAVGEEPSTAQRGVRRRRTGAGPFGIERLGRVSMVLLMVLLAVPFVFPTWWMITSSLKSTSEILRIPPTLWPAAPSVEPYRQVFELQPFAQQYFNSVYIAVLVTVGTIAVAALAGYAFARITFPGANVLFVVVLTGLLVALALLTLAPPPRRVRRPARRSDGRRPRRGPRRRPRARGTVQLGPHGRLAAAGLHRRAEQMGHRHDA